MSRDEIEQLKKSWMSDPCWDIETTEGFEEHAAELLAYRLAKEAEWKAKADIRHDEERSGLARRIGIPIAGNVGLLDYLLSLERELARLKAAEHERSSAEDLESMVELYRIDAPESRI